MTKRTVLMVVGLIVVFVAILSNIYTMSAITGINAQIFMMRVGSILSIATLVVAVYYLVTAFKKESAKFLKGYLYAFIMTEYTHSLDFCVSNLIQNEATVEYIKLVPNVFLLILLSVLLLKKDLGKKVSLILSFICLALNLIVVIEIIIDNFGNPRMVFFLIRWIGNLSMSFVLVVLQMLKYYDKGLRNTK